MGQTKIFRENSPLSVYTSHIHYKRPTTLDHSELQEILHIGLSRRRPLDFRGDLQAEKIRETLAPEVWAEKEVAPTYKWS